MEELEHAFTCPYCNAPISVLLDPSVESQTYVEDCEVCCNPIELAYCFVGAEIEVFFAQSIEQ